MSNQSQMVSSLVSLQSFLPYFPILFSEDISMAIADREKYLVVQYGQELVLKLKAGDPIPEGGAVCEALKTGKTIIKHVPKEVYGVPFQSYAMPVFEDGQVVGVFVVGKSLARKAEIQVAIKCLTSSLQQISDSVNAISAGVMAVANKNTELLKRTNEASDKAEGTNEILGFIKNISTQTNLLGFNAAIEAARAGAAGRGFNIVAQEIRSLSKSTSDSVMKINDLVDYIVKSIKVIDVSIAEANEVFHSQAAALTQIAASLEEVNASSRILEGMSELL